MGNAQLELIVLRVSCCPCRLQRMSFSHIVQAHHALQVPSARPLESMARRAPCVPKANSNHLQDKRNARVAQLATTQTLKEDRSATNAWAAPSPRHLAERAAPAALLGNTPILSAQQAMHRV